MKLNFELVPDSCWYSNLRSALPQGAWDVIRKKAYARANGRCMICGAPAVRLEAHEQWEYDDEKGVQKLANVVAVCRACHEVIHIGRTQLMGREREASEHFMKVNGCTYAEYRKALGEANAVHRERSRREWQLDVSELPKFM
ncbi:MAG: HNH endonuclease [Clostridia bacterium]|nr:HNH endonuclease [Clostridia bacterium]